MANSPSTTAGKVTFGPSKAAGSHRRLDVFLDGQPAGFLIRDCPHGKPAAGWSIVDSADSPFPRAFPFPSLAKAKAAARAALEARAAETAETAEAGEGRPFAVGDKVVAIGYKGVISAKTPRPWPRGEYRGKVSHLYRMEDGTQIVEIRITGTRHIWRSVAADVRHAA